MTDRKLAAVFLAALVGFGVLTGASTFGLFVDREQVQVGIAANVPAAGNTAGNQASALDPPSDPARDDATDLPNPDERAPGDLPAAVDGPAVAAHHAAAARQSDPPDWEPGR